MMHINTTLKRIQWEARRRMRRVSRHMVALAVLGAVTAIAATSALVAIHQANELHAQLAKLPNQATLRPTTHRGPSTLPPYTQRAAQFKQIYDAAQNAGVRLTVAEYQTATKRDGSLVTVKMSAVAKDEYVHIQAALLEILRTLPNVGLESATFRRETRASHRVQARLNLVLYYTPHVWSTKP